MPRSWARSARFPDRPHVVRNRAARLAISWRGSREGGEPAGPDMALAGIREASRLIFVDELTGLYNRRFMRQYLRDRLALLARQGTPLAVIMLDVDGFKQINDTCGHLDGDGVLKLLAQLIRDAIPQGGYAIRFAGDEVFLFLGGVGAAGGRGGAEPGRGRRVLRVPRGCGPRRRHARGRADPRAREPRALRHRQGAPRPLHDGEPRRRGVSRRRRLALGADRGGRPGALPLQARREEPREPRRRVAAAPRGGDPQAVPVPAARGARGGGGRARGAARRSGGQPPAPRRGPPRAALSTAPACRG